MTNKPDVSVEVETKLDEMIELVKSYRYKGHGDLNFELSVIRKHFRAALLANAAGGEPVAWMGEQIAAAEVLAEKYADDDRQDIKIDVMNAFYAGSHWRSRHPVHSDPQPVAVQEAPRNRATEWGEYMAKGGDNLLIAMNEHAEALMALEESEDDDDIAAMTSRCEYTEQLVGEMMAGLRSDIYEFRKRVAQDVALQKLADLTHELGLESAQAAPKAEQDDAPPGWKKTAYGWAQSGESILAEEQSNGTPGADAEDAARYRFLRLARASEGGDDPEFPRMNAEELDAAIDAARDAQGKDATK